jgi:acetolactate synthase I/II/III large subunit
MPKMKGYEAVTQMLDGYGVTHIFMVPAVLRRTMVELGEKTEIRRIHCHGEKSAVYMADGYARASGRPGLCMAQVIGALNIAAGLRDAWLAHSPVIAMTGGRDAKTKFRKVYQEIDDMPAFEPVTKFNATVDDVQRMPDMIRQAFRAAVTGCPGPVHLQFRGNEAQLDLDEADLDPYVEEMFAAVPPYRPYPDPVALKEVLDALQAAERPIVVAGGGVRASRAQAALVAFAEKLGIPVATSLNGKDAIPGTHPLSVGVVGTYSRSSANRAVNEADLVCYIGSETGGMTTHFWQVPPLGTAVVQIDIDGENIGRNYPLKASVQADAKIALEQMVEMADSSGSRKRNAWLSRIGEINDAWRSEYDGLLNSDAEPIRPERICSELTKHVPEDAVVVVDTGHGGMWMGGMFDLKSPNQSYIRSAGHLGWAFPAGLGAKAAKPDRPVVTFTGDAGFWYHIGEVETAVRWGLNSITLVNNNHSGNQSKRGFDRAYGGTQPPRGLELWHYREVNFARLAEDIGAVGLRVEKPGDLGGAIDKALAVKDRPVIIDVTTDIDALAPLAVTE